MLTARGHWVDKWLLAAVAALSLSPWAAGQQRQSRSHLEEAGFDMRLLDNVRKTNRMGLVAADREAFYQLLFALDRLPADASLQPEGASAPDIVSLLETPEAYQGQCLPLEGVARRVVKVSVSDADIQQRLGIDHYFEIDLLVPLGDKRLKFGDGNAPGPVYESRFPATLVVRRLPAGLLPGENVRQQIQAEAVFFKVWSYPSEYTRPFAQLQAAPLFIAAEAQLVPEPANNTGVLNLVFGLALASLALAAAVAFWRIRRSDRAYASERARQRISDQSVPPDFSGLK
jgi:hypothetical protein